MITDGENGFWTLSRYGLQLFVEGLNSDGICKLDSGLVIGQYEYYANAGICSDGDGGYYTTHDWHRQHPITNELWNGVRVWCTLENGSLDWNYQDSVFIDYYLSSTGRKSYTRSVTLPDGSAIFGIMFTGYGTSRLRLFKIHQDGTIEGQIVPVAESPIPSVLTELRLVGVYPTPFNSSVSIRMQLPGSGPYTFSVFDVTGSLVDRFQCLIPSGEAVRFWRPSSNLGSGIYFLKVMNEQQPETSDYIRLYYVK